MIVTSPSITTHSNSNVQNGGGDGNDGSFNQFGMIIDNIPSEIEILFLIIYKKKTRGKICCLWIWEFPTSVPVVECNSQPGKTLCFLGT